jgi:taurine dioxygenase
MAIVRQALIDYQVIFVRDQHLTETEQLGLARHLGTPMAHPVNQLMGEDVVIANIEDTAESPPDADQWHTDITYWPAPPKFGLLSALDIPATGGDTLWASLYAAYEALSSPLQQLCARLRALHAPSRHFVESWTRRHGPEHRAAIEKQLAGAVLPLVRTHDDTGRSVLFRTSAMTILDVNPTESDRLLDYFAHIVNDPNLQVRWKWRNGDVAIWDERCTNHRALSDHYPRHRLMRRCTVEGEPAFFRPEGAREPLFTAALA